jgi:hypothetical protein
MRFRGSQLESLSLLSSLLSRGAIEQEELPSTVERGERGEGEGEGRAEEREDEK